METTGFSTRFASSSKKIVTVVKVLDFSKQNFVERDLMLIKVSTDGGEGKRSEELELCDIFRGKVIDVGPTHVMIEIAGQELKIEAFIEVMRPYGIIELVRTGRVALIRSAAGGSGEIVEEEITSTPSVDESAASL